MKLEFPVYKSNIKIHNIPFKMIAYDVISLDGKYIGDGVTLNKIKDLCNSDSYNPEVSPYNCQVTRKDIQKVTDWLNNQDMQNDYFKKALESWNKEELEYSDLALVASVIGSYFKNKKREEENIKYQDSAYVGEVGDTVSLTAKHVKKIYTNYYMDSEYITYMILGTDNNVYLVSTSKILSTEDRLNITGVVKDHTTFNGIKQTVLRKCKINEA